MDETVYIEMMNELIKSINFGAVVLFCILLVLLLIAFCKVAELHHEN